MIVVKETLYIDDSAIVKGCKHGNREAMSLLYTRYAPRMLRLISFYVKNSDDAKDILHDGFIAAFTRIDTLQDPAKIDHWLATIIKNLSLKFLQEQSVVSLLNEIPEEPSDDCEIDNIIDFETLETLICRLPDGYQKVFRLAVLENKTHKEIAQILGIAPNSSSSQLFHAKMHLRKLIIEYKKTAGTLVLLLIAVATGIYISFNNSDYDGTMSFQPKTSETAAYPVAQHTKTSANIATTTISVNTFKKQGLLFSMSRSKRVTADSIPPIPTKTRKCDFDSSLTNNNVTISEATSSPKEIFEYNYTKQDYENDNSADNSYKKNSEKGWSAGVTFDPGIINIDKSLNNGELAGNEHIHDYLKYQNHKNMLPITVGINIEKRITSWLGIESGLTYTYLHTDFEYHKNHTQCYWHYIGIPLKANLYAYSSSKIRIYGSVGGGIEIPAYSTTKSLNGRDDLGYSYGNFNSPVVWTLSGSIGIALPLSRKIDIYLEPTLKYNFPHRYRVPNVWSEHPCNISIPIGVRFKW